jgi:hypothetical protein
MAPNFGGKLTANRKKPQSHGGIDVKGSPFQGLFENLAHIIAESRKKFDNCHTKNSERLSWARVVIGGCAAYSAIYEKSALEDLQSRIKALEDRLAKQPKEG